MLTLGLALALLSAPQPKELGQVAWRRDFSAAQKEAEEKGLPLLFLFDEIPGCSTCVHYGQVVLSDPLLVEAAETLFVPVAVYNNQDGDDRAMLSAFGEPAWNNPVVRIAALRSDGNGVALPRFGGPARHALPLAPRLNGDYERAGLARSMVEALKAAGAPVPEWLALHAQALTAEERGLKTSTFAMGCFWEGEACFGGLDGVVASRTGFISGREVVEVSYDPRQLSDAALEGRGCGKKIAGRFSPSTKDDQYHLQHSPWAQLKLTPAQASRVNAALAARQDPSPFVSPRQLAQRQAR